MEKKEIYRNLCAYDSRNPDCVTEAEDIPTGAKVDCYCDNCFYRRHVLAVEILRLTEYVKKGSGNNG